MNLEQELFGDPQKGPFKKIVLPTLVLFALAYLAYYAFVFYLDLNYKFEPLDESDKQFKERGGKNYPPSDKKYSREEADQMIRRANPIGDTPRDEYEKSIEDELKRLGY